MLFLHVSSCCTILHSRGLPTRAAAVASQCPPLLGLRCRQAHLQARPRWAFMLLQVASAMLVMRPAFLLTVVSTTKTLGALQRHSRLVRKFCIAGPRGGRGQCGGCGGAPEGSFRHLPRLCNSCSACSCAHACTRAPWQTGQQGAPGRGAGQARGC
jgi:hypothetical protein